MCSNYHPATPDKLRFHFGVAQPDADYKDESYPGYMAPIIRPPHADAVPGDRACALAMFGMVPYWADTKLARQTYNARTETVATKPSFRNAFKRGQFCIVPANSFFEPEKMQAFGEKSKQSLSAMCFGQDAYYDAHAIDKYRRTVAVVSCGGVEVNRAQVERGMAWGYTKYNNDLPLLAIESQAAARRPLSACERSQAIWLLPARSSI